MFDVDSTKAYKSLIERYYDTTWARYRENFSNSKQNLVRSGAKEKGTSPDKCLNKWTRTQYSLFDNDMFIYLQLGGAAMGLLMLIQDLLVA